jgi:hypothetical protein
VDEFIVSTEQAAWYIGDDQRDMLRAKVCGILRAAKLPKHNLPNCERKALREVQKEKSIMILPADKGRATVIMDPLEYQDKMTTMLSDTTTYEKLRKDPTQGNVNQNAGVPGKSRKDQERPILVSLSHS